MEIKIFEAIPVLAKLYQASEKSKIECFAYFNTILYIGTNDGFILRYSVNRSRIVQNKINYESTLIDFKPITQKKAILKMSIHENIRKLIFLTDNLLSSVNLYDLETSTSLDALKIRNAICYAYNKNTKKVSGLELFVSTREDKIQIYVSKTVDTFILKNEILLDDTCINLESNSNYLCIVTRTQYMVLNTDNYELQKLFSFDIMNFAFNPYVCTVEEGFLLNCPGNFGKVFSFADKSISTGQFDFEQKCQFQYQYPYVVCLMKDQIKIFNYFTKNLNQRIQFPLGDKLRLIEEDNIFLVSTLSHIVVLDSIPLDMQIENLVIKNQIEDAISLFDKIDDKYDKKRVIYLKTFMGYVELFENKNFESAKKFFLQADVDYRELLSFIPAFTKQSSSCKNYLSYVALKSFEDTIENNILEIKELVLQYMLECKATKNTEYIKALLTLCVQHKPALLNKPELYKDLSLSLVLENIKVLEEQKLYHTIALVNSLSNKPEVSLGIWRDLEDKNIEDKCFPGFDYIVNYLCTLQDAKLVWKYADWLFSKNQEQAVRVFIERPSNELQNEFLRTELIVEYLKNYKNAQIIYLEHLIFSKQNQKEKYHTHLAQTYIDDAISFLKLVKTEEKDAKIKLDSTRCKLQYLLKYSTVCRFKILIEKIADYEDYFVKELSILYSKIGEHDKALELIIYKLNDHDGAIDYCISNSNNSRQLKKKLFSKLLSSYMLKDKLDFSATIEQLFNNKLIEFDLSRVVETVPLNWNLNKISDFLQRNLLKLNSSTRILSVQKSLFNYQNLQSKEKLMKLKNKKFVLNDQSRCNVCEQNLTPYNFYMHSNGTITHAECS